MFEPQAHEFAEVFFEQVPRSEVNMFNTEDQRLTSKTGHFSLASGGRKTGDFPEDWGFSQIIEAGNLSGTNSRASLYCQTPTLRLLGICFLVVPLCSFRIFPVSFAESGSRNQLLEPCLLFLGFCFFLQSRSKKTPCSI